MKPGDLVFAHGKGVISAAIRFVQSWRSPDADAHWNHVAVLYEYTTDKDWTVLQAEGKGVVVAWLADVAPGGTYEVVSCPPGIDPAKVVEFAESQVGVKYGFLTIASIVLNVILPRRIALRKPGTYICSALAGASLMFAGWPTAETFDDLYQITPAELYGMTANK